jgi:serine/threonine protein kinase
VSTLQEQLQRALASTYVVERELGGGGMSRVYLAHETALGRKVAVKVLLPELAAGVNVERFRREILLAAQLQHPHIVPLLAAGEAEGLPYLIMPYVSGESLRARVTREGELPIAETVRILRDVVSALAYAHSYGVVHRDVKPDNVLLSGGVAVVTDFGVAKAVSASADTGATGLTSMGVALGTPAYMAPEQATANPHTDHRADLYALGVTAYELLTGAPPFAGRPPQAVLAAHVIEEPEPVERRRGAVPPPLAELVRACLAKRPADRPQSAAQVMHMLDSIATPSGGTAATTAVRVPAVPPTPATRRVWPVAAAALVVIAGVAAGAVLLRREGSPPQPATIPVADSSPKAVPTPAAAAPTLEEVGTAGSDTSPTPAAPTPSPRASKRARTAPSGPVRPKPARIDSTTSVAAAGGPPAEPSAPENPPAQALVPTPATPPETAAAAPAPPVAPAPTPAPAPPAQPPAARAEDVPREIRNLIGQYASAIEARNLSGLQRVYPGMTGLQQRGWEQFFQLVRNIKADLSVTSLQIAGATADAQVSGTYSYLNTSTGGAERQPVSFHATFQRDATQWRISQVR